MHNPWKIEKWHVRTALRRGGIWCPGDHVLELPAQDITGPSPDQHGKCFSVFITVLLSFFLSMHCFGIFRVVLRFSRSITRNVPVFFVVFLYIATIPSRHFRFCDIAKVNLSTLSLFSLALFFQRTKRRPGFRRKKLTVTRNLNLSTELKISNRLLILHTCFTVYELRSNSSHVFPLNRFIFLHFSDLLPSTKQQNVDHFPQLFRSIICNKIE